MSDAAFDGPEFRVPDAASGPDAVARWAAHSEPAALLLASVHDIDPTRLSPGGRIDLLVALERAKACLEAQQQQVLAEIAAQARPAPPAFAGLDGPRAAADPALPAAAQAAAQDKQWVREEVACALRIAAPTAAARLATAVELTTRLPRTLAALDSGTITLPMARRLAEEVAPLDDLAAARVQRRVLPRAGTQTFSQFAAAVRRAVLAADPRRAEEQAAAARADRRVTRRPGAPGMTDISASVPAESGARIWDRLNAAAGCGQCAACSADPRTTDQRRADAFIALLTGTPDGSSGCCRCRASGSDSGGSDNRTGNDGAGDASSDSDSGRSEHGRSGPKRRRNRSTQGPAVQVIVALSTLLGIDDQPGELAGHGPIPAALARAIAADPTGTWRRLVTDRYGQLLDYGRTTYEPPANLADHVRARDGSCRFPSCTRRAANCELDHRIAYAAGGETSDENLHPLCARDHHLKHEAGWSVVRHADDSTTWTTPTGHTYTKPPPDHLPLDTTATSATTTGSAGSDEPAAPNAPPASGATPPPGTDPPPF